MVRLSAPSTADSSRSAPAARNMAVRSRPTSIPARAKEIGSSATAENIAKLITLPIRAGSVRSWSHETVTTPRKLDVAPIAVARATAATRLGTKAILPTIMPSRPVSPSSIRPRPDPALHGDPLADHAAGRVPPLAAGAIGTAETRHDEAPAEEPEPAELRSSLATNLLAFFFIFYILCWNLTRATSFTLPERTVPLGTFLGLDQYWGMFAPSPSNEDGWYVIPGELRDGRKVDLMPIIRDDYGMHPISYEKPQDIPATYKNEHWRKYLENIYNQDHADQRLYFGQYICRQWNVGRRATGAVREVMANPWDRIALASVLAGTALHNSAGGRQTHWPQRERRPELLDRTLRRPRRDHCRSRPEHHLPIRQPYLDATGAGRHLLLRGTPGMGSGVLLRDGPAVYRKGRPRSCSGPGQERPEHERHDGSLAAGQRGRAAGRGAA